mmetsp:Transcript_14419/g.17096  ORF Transcript_14419/g.17096 Transcript_14419/m.17096 type:complete len:201 (+) Transcript_14419:1668-2270(+)
MLLFSIGGGRLALATRLCSLCRASLASLRLAIEAGPGGGWASAYSIAISKVLLSVVSMACNACSLPNPISIISRTVSSLGSKGGGGAGGTCSSSLPLSSLEGRATPKYELRADKFCVIPPLKPRYSPRLSVDKDRNAESVLPSLLLSSLEHSSNEVRVSPRRETIGFMTYDGAKTKCGLVHSSNATAPTLQFTTQTNRKF